MGHIQEILAGLQMFKLPADFRNIPLFNHFVHQRGPPFVSPVDRRQNVLPQSQLEHGP